MISIGRKGRAGLVLLGVLVLVLSVFVAGCGGSSDETTTTVAPTTSSDTTATTGGSTDTSAGSSTSASLSGDEALIAENWIKFFDGTQPAADKVGLLQDGDQYTDQIDAQASSPMGQAASAEVTAVAITSPTTADVTYTILVSGIPALPDQKGQAVLQDGVWKVASEAFLALLALQGASGTP